MAPSKLNVKLGYLSNHVKFCSIVLRTYSLIVVFTSQFHCESKCELDMKNKVFWSACPDVGFGMANASDKSPYNTILCFI